MANSQCHHMCLFLLAISLAPGIFRASASASTCVVPASGTNATDDAPAILEAFDECGQGGTITFSADTTYYVNSVMNVSGLQDAVIDIQGTLLVSCGPFIHAERGNPARLTQNLVEHRSTILAEQLS